MKNKYLLRGLLPIAALFHGALTAQTTLVHYWNFNNSTSEAAMLAPTSTLLGGSITASTSLPNTYVDFANGTGQNFTAENARNSDPIGTHLRYNYPTFGNLQFNIPTTGYNNVVVKFITRRSGSGAGTQTWSYSTNGTTYQTFQTVSPVDGAPTLTTLDFSAIAGASNNPNFKLKVEFAAGSGGAVGNNRFDNFSVDATPTGVVDTTSPTIAYLPANNVNNASTTANPTITFNENVRLIDNSAITSANAQGLVELRLNNATGTVVPFTTIFANNAITVIPTAGLVPNQAYYLALKPNLVEDTSDNAVTAATSSTFTTAATSIALDKNLIKVCKSSAKSGHLILEI
jgi:hypothetical protein